MSEGTGQASEDGQSQQMLQTQQTTAATGARSPDEIAEELRLAGNEAVIGAQFADAEAKYTQAIELLRAHGSTVPHTFYGNRSLVRLELGRAQAALKDADAALRQNPLWTKVDWNASKHSCHPSNSLIRLAHPCSLLCRITHATALLTLATVHDQTPQPRCQQLVSPSLALYCNLNADRATTARPAHTEPWASC